MRVFRFTALLVLSTCHAVLGTPNFPIVKIADTSTAIPNGTGNFVSFTEPTIAGPASSGPDGNSYKAYFQASGAGNFQGVYYGSGVGTLSPTLSRVADTTMPIPGLTGNYGSFGGVSGGNGFVTASSRVAFSATSSTNANQKGIYVSTQGNAPTLVVNSASVNGHSVATLGDAGATADSLSFRADGAIYGTNNVLIADTTTSIPGGALGEKFALLGVPHAFDNGDTERFVGFRGASGTSSLKGIYVHDTLLSPQNSALFKVADTNTLVPGGNSNFIDFGDITGNLFTSYFRGISAAKQGIYRCLPLYKNPTLIAFVESGEVAPDSSGETFSSFGDPSTNSSSSSLAWTATLSDGREGIYATGFGGFPKLRVIDTHDLLDGKTIADLSISPVAFTSSRTIVFKATFTDGSQGIYDAVLVPEPVTAVFVAALPFLIGRPGGRPTTLRDRLAIVEGIS